MNKGRHVCVAVTDTGTGMDKDTLIRAIEPFYTTKGVGKGTGLGLPMVHGIAEQSGGKLILKSTPGKGTTAEICLPVAEGEIETKISEGIKQSRPEFTRGLKIVSVDDDPLVGFNTSAMLEDLGHTVLSASSGAQALELLRREQNVDLLITDQAMPGMTGSELAEAILAERPGFSIIIATGYAELPHGPAQLLPRLAKPFFQDDLADAIAKVARSSG